MTPTQRWRDRRDTLLSPDGRALFDPSDYGVERLDSDTLARRFIEQHHYSGSYVVAVERFGLFRAPRIELVGVCVFSIPMQPASITKHTGCDAGLELGRLVMLDDVPYNAESWFVAQAFRELKRLRGRRDTFDMLGRVTRPKLRSVLSYSDPVPREISGRLVMPGHVGIVYQALNAAYVGRSGPQHHWLDHDGRVISRRGLSKIRLGEVGWEPAAERLIAAGAEARRFGEEPKAWLDRVLPTFRRMKHPGNHAYVWRLDGVRLPSLPYPRRAVTPPSECP